MKIVLMFLQFFLLAFVALISIYNYVYKREAKRAGEELEIKLPIRAINALDLNIGLSIIAVIILGLFSLITLLY